MSKLIELTGEGFTIAIAPDAQAQGLALVTEAKAITQVKGEDEKSVAMASVKELSAYLVLLEKSRKLVKEPVLELGRKIDAKAQECASPLEREKTRLTALVSTYSAEQLRLQREAEEKQRQAAAEAARLQREEELQKARAELLRQQAVAAEAAARTKKQKEAAEKARAEAEAAQAAAEALEQEARDASWAQTVEEDAALAVPTQTKVKPVLDYEVVDIRALYAAFPGLCDITPRRADILSALKGMQDAGEKPEIPGLKVVERIKVSTR